MIAKHISFLTRKELLQAVFKSQEEDERKQQLTVSLAATEEKSVDAKVGAFLFDLTLEVISGECVRHILLLLNESQGWANFKNGMHIQEKINTGCRNTKYKIKITEIEIAPYASKAKELFPVCGLYLF